MAPIGFFKTAKKKKYEAARQATADSGSFGVIELNPKQNFEQALEGLEGFSHIWVVYQFHQSITWKPKVQPPRGSKNKVGVFATRSPYRPNQIGISALAIQKIVGRKIYVTQNDLLDGTPILDIKPYLAYSDSIPDAKMGWLENIEKEKFEVSFKTDAKELSPEFKNFLKTQLEFDPTNKQKKRVKMTTAEFGTIAYQKLRADFSIRAKKIEIHKIYSV